MALPSPTPSLDSYIFHSCFYQCNSTELTHADIISRSPWLSRALVLLFTELSMCLRKHSPPVRRSRGAVYKSLIKIALIQSDLAFTPFSHAECVCHMTSVGSTRTFWRLSVTWTTESRPQEYSDRGLTNARSEVLAGAASSLWHQSQGRTHFRLQLLDPAYDSLRHGGDTS